MKNYTLILCMFLLSGCLNNDFMERYPLGNPTMGHRTKRFFQWSGKMGERF